MTATVVVLSRTPGDWLAPCLASVAGQAERVLLVDNGSDGAAAAALGRAHGADVIRSARNLGYAGGVNLALRSVRSDVVALLNDDAVAGPGWIDRATASLADPSVAAVTPKVRMAGSYRQVVFDDPRWPAPGDHRTLGRRIRSVRCDGVEVLDRVVGVGIHRLEGEPGDQWRWTVPDRPWYVPVAGADAVVTIDGEPLGDGPACHLLNKAGSYLRSNGALGDIGAETPDDGRWDRPAECFFASGTAMVARTESFRRLGGFAEEFFAYYEDGDWSWRARLAGMRLLYDPSTTVDHRVSATAGSGPWVHRLALRNQTLCLIRNAPLTVARDAVRRTIAAGPTGGVRGEVLRRLPWALRTRRQLARRWSVSPASVWSRWADADTTWDDGALHAAATTDLP